MKYLLLINKKIKTTDMLNNMNEPRNKYSESKKSDQKKKIREKKSQIKKIYIKLQKMQPSLQQREVDQYCSGDGLGHWLTCSST